MCIRDRNISPNADDVIEESDILIAIGASDELSKLENMISR